METLKSVLFVLMIPLLGTIGLLLIAGGADGKFEDEGIRKINHTKESVYEWLVDPARRVTWGEGLISSKSAERRIEAGATLHETYDDGDGRRQRTVKVLQADYGNLLVLQITEPGSVVEVTYALSVHQSARRTRVDVSTRGTLDGWWAKLVEPLLAARIQERVESDLDRLAEKLAGA